MSTDARPAQPSSASRALLVFAVVMCFGAAAVAAFALWPSSGAADDAVLEVTTLTAASAPETIPPRSTAPVVTVPPIEETDAPATSERPDAAATATTTNTSTTTLPPPAVPLGVTIGDIELWGPVIPVGLEESGELEVPGETEVGWYELGSTPGRAGSTVLAAHVTWNSTFGPFYNLGTLEPGALVDVHLDDDTTRTYEVVERTMYDKDALPRDRIWRRTGDETLVLITCGGSFNPEINRYRQNIVVYAVPVA